VNFLPVGISMYMMPPDDGGGCHRRHTAAIGY
jgi:hypothetical protein